MERRTVGFDYRVTLEEMEFVAYQDLSRPRRELLPLVREFVGRDGAGTTTQHSTANILLNIWHGHAQESEAVSMLRERARRMMTEVDVGERRALHWGMALLVYPFFQAFARQVGVALELEREVDVRRINRSIQASLWRPPQSRSGLQGGNFQHAGVGGLKHDPAWCLCTHGASSDWSSGSSPLAGRGGQFMLPKRRWYRWR